MLPFIYEHCVDEFLHSGIILISVIHDMAGCMNIQREKERKELILLFFL